MGNEIWQAARRLLRTPVFTLAAALTLALAIGANATIFAVVQRVVLNPLPYPESDRLVRLDHGMARINILSGIGMTSGLYYQYERARTLEGLAIYRAGESTLAGRGEPERIEVARTTPALAAVLPARSGDLRVDHAYPLGCGPARVLAARAPRRTHQSSGDAASWLAVAAGSSPKARLSWTFAAETCSSKAS